MYTLASVETSDQAVNCADKLARSCCAEWGHDLALAPEHSEGQTCFRCGAVVPVSAEPKYLGCTSPRYPTQGMETGRDYCIHCSLHRSEHPPEGAA